MKSLTDRIIDSGRVPDVVLRRAMRRMLRRRLAQLRRGGVEQQTERKRALLATLDSSPIAIDTAHANEQHYEVPTALFELMLGDHMKYSSGWWPQGVVDLNDAERRMLELTCERAQLADGQRILELGCGWGSLTLFMAQHYPQSTITAISNSTTQRDHITRLAHERGLSNVAVYTRDVTDLAAERDLVADGKFDRVMSVEMFEHVRNHRQLTAQIAQWLATDGKLFVHIFAHREHAYLFETGVRGDWMARHFFTGGMMPADDLLVYSVQDLRIEDHWVLSGSHYARTLRAWLDRLDRNEQQAKALLAETYGIKHAHAWFHRWRVFTMACEELFRYNDGNEWHVSHYRFVKP